MDVKQNSQRSHDFETAADEALQAARATCPGARAHRSIEGGWNAEKRGRYLHSDLRRTQLSIFGGIFIRVNWAKSSSPEREA